MKENKTKKPS